MKKIIAVLLFILLNITTSYADNTGKIHISDTDFSANCFEYYSEIKSWSFEADEIFSYTSIYDEPVLVQWEYLLPMQYFSVTETPYVYTSDILNNIESLSDDNKNTSLLIDTSKNRYIQLDFWDFIDDKNLIINLDHQAKYHTLSYMISADWKKYIEIDEHDFSHYSFQYVRVMLNKNINSQKEEQIHLTELKFSSANFTYMVENYTDEKIKLYAHNRCENSFWNFNYNQTLPSNINTKKITSYFEENPSLVTNPNADSDNDGTIDKFDNCPIISNPIQQDSDSNGIWDLCSDDDNDGIYGDTDNCIDTYNPDQSDIDKDNIWDKCDEQDQRFMESNKTFFILLLLLIIGLFGFGIFSMMKKLK